MQSGNGEKVGWGTTLVYGQGQLGLNLAATLLALHLLYFYSDRRGLSPSLAGAAFFIALALDALTDPLVGNISDRARFRFGRRRPFFIAGVPMGLCFFLLLSPPKLSGGLFVWLCGFYFLTLTARKFYETAYGALMPELTLDYDERTKLSTFRQLFGTGGDISGAMLPFAASYLLAKGTDFRATGALAGAIIAGGALAALFGTHERPEFSQRSQHKLRASVITAFQNRPFVILLAAYTLAMMAINVPGVLMRFLAKYWMHDDGVAARWLLAYFAGSVLSYPFWFRITVAIEKKAAFVTAIASNALASLALLLLSPSNTLLLHGLMMFSGFSGIGIWITQMAAAADVIEWDEERTGMRQEGAYAGLTSMSVKLAVGASMLMVGPLLAAVGYSPGAEKLSPRLGENIKLLFTLIPASIYSIGALIFMRYPITRESHRQLRERIAGRSAALGAKSLAS